LKSNKINPVKEFLKVKEEGIFKKLEEQRKKEEDRGA
jgi:hypothetical protein